MPLWPLISSLARGFWYPVPMPTKPDASWIVMAYGAWKGLN